MSGYGFKRVTNPAAAKLDHAKLDHDDAISALIIDARRRDLRALPSIPPAPPGFR